jgi:hypothetical protein
MTAAISKARLESKQLVLEGLGLGQGQTDMIGHAVFRWLERASLLSGEKLTCSLR